MPTRAFRLCIQLTRGGAVASPRSSPRRCRMLPPWPLLDATACPSGRTAGVFQPTRGGVAAPLAHHPGAGTCCHPGLHWMLRRALAGVPLVHPAYAGGRTSAPAFITQTLARAATLGSSGYYRVLLWAYAGASHYRVRALPRPCALHPDAGTCCYSGPQWMHRRAFAGVRWRIRNPAHVWTRARAAILSFNIFRRALAGFSGTSCSRVWAHSCGCCGAPLRTPLDSWV